VVEVADLISLWRRQKQHDRYGKAMTVASGVRTYGMLFKGSLETREIREVPLGGKSRTSLESEEDLTACRKSY
jgi:hypothetical protein